MKANELMIGDWVYRPACYDKVKEIRNTGVIGIDNMRGLIAFSEIEPIPITAEILEKNGFYYDEDRKAYLMGVIFRVKPERYGLFSFEICGCPYSLNTVHELQHALRLCGIEKTIEL